MTTKHNGQPKRALVIQHLAFEDLGSFEAALIIDGFDISYYSAGSDDLSVIDAATDDVLIILGGPISVNDVDEYPFLQTELDLLAQRIAMNKPTLGICLGAQLIATALGAKVYPGGQKEIGWSPLSLTDAGQQSVLKHCAPDTPVLHWHGETFDLPDGATLLASTELYTNQAFSFGNMLALQFHPEVTEAGLEQWYIGHTGEISQTGGISVAQLRDDSRRYAPALQGCAEAILSDWLAQAESA